MIAKVIAWGRDRDGGARPAAPRAGRHRGRGRGRHDEPGLPARAARPPRGAPRRDRHRLARRAPASAASTVSVRHADVALLARRDRARRRRDRGRPRALLRLRAPGAARRPARGSRAQIELRHRGQRLPPERRARSGPAATASTLDGTVARGRRRARSNVHERRLDRGRPGVRTLTSSQGGDLLVEVDGVPHRVSRDDGGIVRNLAPAVVVALPVEPGDEVAAGDVVAVVESMKMETSLTAPFRGRVRQVLVGPNVQVGAPRAARPARPARGRRRWTRAPSGCRSLRSSTAAPLVAPARCHANLRAARAARARATTCEPGEVARIVADLHGACSDTAGVRSVADRPASTGCSALFADVHALTRPRHDDRRPGRATLLRSPQEYLHAYLRSLDAEAEGLPAGFVARLRARARATTASTGSSARRRWRRPATGSSSPSSAPTAPGPRSSRSSTGGSSRPTSWPATWATTSARRSTGSTQAAERRDPVLADLAREMRYRYFDEPRDRAPRASATYAEMEGHLDALAADPPRAGARARRQRARRVPAAARAAAEPPPAQAPRPPLRRVLLEMMTRRYYRTRRSRASRS